MECRQRKRETKREPKGKECNTVVVIVIIVVVVVGRDSSVGVATRYGLDGPGIESWWGRDFPHPSRPTLGPTQPPI